MPNFNRARSWCASRRAASAIAAIVLVTANGAWAGVTGSITHGPLSATAVPTLGGAALILLAAMMALVAVRVIKSRQLNGGQFMLAALVTGAIASGASGIKLVADAHANGFNPVVSLTNPAGDTLPLVPGLNCVTNNTGIVQQIVDIETVEQSVNGGVSSNGGLNGGTVNGGAPSTFDCPAAGVANSGTVPVPVCSDDPATVLQPDGTCAVSNFFPG